MPVIKNSTYSCPWWLHNPHLATIIPSLIRKVEFNGYIRERIDTPDEDFLDLDWVKANNDRLIIISHGLEGSSNRTYVKGLVKLAREKKWDVLAWNCRSCSGEINLKPRFYHHGDSVDLDYVIQHAKGLDQYSEIALVGYSMGGSMIGRYLGIGEHIIPKNIIAAVAISTPFDLQGSASKLDGPGMGFYRNRFLKKLGEKVITKSKIWPDLFDAEGFDEINTFRQFDDCYTAPLHGFRDAGDFYKQASAGQHLHGVKIPFLILNALDDPFLTEDCYPHELARRNHQLILDAPKKGGHVGFMTGKKSPTWSELRIFEFLSEHSST